MGFFDRLREGLTRTKQQIVERFEEIVQQRRRAGAAARGPIDVDTIEALEELLISADVGVAATERIVDGGARRGAARREPARSGQERDPRRLRATPSGRARERARPHVTLDRRRERHRQDDDHRQAGQSAEGHRQAAARLRGRHVPRGGGRAARDLGDARRRRYRARERRAGSRGGGVRRDLVRARRAAATRSSWTRPAACTRA